MIRTHLRRCADLHAPHFDAEFVTVEVIVTPDHAPATEGAPR